MTRNRPGRGILERLNPTNMPIRMNVIHARGPILVDWIYFYSDIANPLNKRSIRKKAGELAGKKLGKS